MTEICAVDVAEVYSPERFAKRALGLGLPPGLAVDLELGWDLRDPEMRAICERELDEQDPLLTITCPPCTAFSRLRKHTRAEEEEGDLHLDFNEDLSTPVRSR